MKNLDSMMKNKLEALGNGRRRLHPVQNHQGKWVTIDGQKLIHFSSNDYLGLSQHPQMILAAQAAAAAWGVGAGASALVAGYSDLTAQIEARLAAWKNTENALVLSSGFGANHGVLAAILDPELYLKEPIILVDRLAHASILSGVLASGAKWHRYHHGDLNHLESLLKKYSEHPIWIVTESIFSMDGDVSDLAGLWALKQKYGAHLYLDEAHATGVFGQNGAGLAHQYPGLADVVMGTFSKAFGAYGAYVAVSSVMKEYLINKTASYIYSTALPPSVLATILQALDLIPSMDEARKKLQDLSGDFRSGLHAKGYDTLTSATQIIPCVLGDNAAAISLSQSIRENGFFVHYIRPPTVPSGTSRLRFSLSALHEQDDIQQLLKILPDA